MILRVVAILLLIASIEVGAGNDVDSPVIDVDACSMSRDLHADAHAVVRQRASIDWHELWIESPDGRGYTLTRDRLGASETGMFVWSPGRLTAKRHFGEVTELVFQQRGRYRLYFADNVETERDNAIFCEYGVDFDGLDFEVVNAEWFGGECRMEAVDPAALAQAYFRSAEPVTSERWQQQDIYRCGLAGSVRLQGVAASFRIDLSGAGVLFSDTARVSELPLDLHFRCDLDCRRGSGWRMEQANFGQDVQEE